jgi:hypothetical protein
MRSDDRRVSRSEPLHPGETSGTADWTALLPVSVVALGAPTQPTERLLGIQSTISRAVNAFAYAGPRLRSRQAGDVAGKCDLLGAVRQEDG